MHIFSLINSRRVKKLGLLPKKSSNPMRNVVLLFCLSLSLSLLISLPLFFSISPSLPPAPLFLFLDR